MNDMFCEYISFDIPQIPVRVNTGCPNNRNEPEHADHPTMYYKHGWHEQVEFLYFRQGHATVLCEDREITVQTGDTVFVNPYEIHEICEASEDYLYDCIIIDLRQYVSNETLNCDGYFFNLLLNRRIHFQNLIPQNALVAEHLQQICVELLEQKFAYELSVQSHILGLFSHLFRHYLCNGTIQSSKHIELYNRIKPAIDYMESHLQERITLKQLSLLCNLSRSHFSRLFRDVMDTTPTCYLLNLRLDEAATLIKSTQMSIAEIAAETGFDNPAYFSRKFKARFSVSPLVFRRQNNVF